MASLSVFSRNGVVVPPEQASVSILNPALYGAYGVYESLKVVSGLPFAEDAHLARLARSAEILGLALPASLPTLKHWMAEILAVSAAQDCTLRLFVVGPDNGGEVVAYLWTRPLPVYPADFFRIGAPAITFAGCRYLPQAKSLNSLASYMAQRAAAAAGAHEALLHHAGVLTEGSNSNLFAFIDGVLVTPPATDVLAGVTRDVAIAVAAANGLPVQERALPLAEIGRWQECFITSTSRHVMPISTVDGRPVGSGAVGPVTHAVMALYDAYFAAHTRPHGAAPAQPPAL